MKILVGSNIKFTPNTGVGGHIYEIALRLRKVGHNIDYCFSANHVPLLINIPSYPFFAAVKVKFKEYDVVHFHTADGYIYGLVKNRMFVMTSHGSDAGVLREFKIERRLGHVDNKKEFFYLKMKASQECISVKKADRIIGVSSSTVREISDAYKICKDRLRVIHNGVDSNFFSPKRGVIPELTKLTDPKILMIGNWSWRKGYYYLLKAFSRVLKEIPKAKLVIIGGINRKVMSRYLSSNVRQSIVFYNFAERSTLPKFYNSCDIFVLPSLYEGHPLTILEAMACGKAVVAFAVCGIPETLDEKTGLLVPPRSVKALGDSLVYLLENFEIAEKMGQAGRKKVIEQFTWDRTAEQTLNVYRELLQKNYSN